VSAYHSLLDVGIEKDYAIELFADIGWKVYIKFLPLLSLISRITTRNDQRRINLMLRILMIFPFSTPGLPGYECKAWSETDCYCTYWTHCPPFEFVRKYVETHGDRGEIEAYQKSWCEYDWALAFAMVNGGFGVKGHYERQHTLSSGDEICDMRWYAESKTVEESSNLIRTLSNKGIE
jgi:hypothetical protein